MVRIDEGLCATTLMTWTYFHWHSVEVVHHRLATGVEVDSMGGAPHGCCLSCFELNIESKKEAKRTRVIALERERE